MLVKVKPGYSIYREGYLREPEHGVFRLYETPPPKDVVAQIPNPEPGPGKPAFIDHPDGVTQFDKWFGGAIEEASDHEKQLFEHDEYRNVEFSETVAGNDYASTLGRAGNLMMTIGKLNHHDDSHWTKDGEPKASVVEALSNQVNVQQHEIRAVAPDVRRLSAEERNKPTRGRIRENA